MKVPFYDPKEERLNYLTHGVSTIISILGLVFLVKAGWSFDDSWMTAGFTIFGLTLIATFLSSTIYHSVRKTNLKKIFRLVDHAAIYLLIAGTYTPFALGNLRNDWGLFVFVLIWTLAIGGIIFKILARNHLDKLTNIDAAIYVVLGCLALLFIKSIVSNVDIGGLVLLATGGISYLVGVYFYLDKRIPYNHAVWHLFVMAGACLHYFSVLYFAIPPAS